MSTAVATIERQPRSVLVDMSTRYGMEPAAFEATLRATVCKGNVSREEFAAFLLVAKEYHLNPLTKEIYAFPAKGGGIQPIVSIDGWCRIINEHPALDGLEFEDVVDEGELIAITCRIFRKDRGRATSVTEYMDECRRSTDVWRTWPARMLRHKALIQAARYAFGFSGIVDPDEYERAIEAPVGANAGTGMRERLEARESTGGFDPAHISAELDAVLDDDQIPDHDVETGEITDAEVSDFPGDETPQESTSSQGGEAPNKASPGADAPLTLEQRVAGFKARCKDATTTTKLKALHQNAGLLRDDLDAKDPEAAVGLNEWFNAVYAEVEDAKRVR